MTTFRSDGYYPGERDPRRYTGDMHVQVERQKDGTIRFVEYWKLTRAAHLAMVLESGGDGWQTIQALERHQRRIDSAETLQLLVPFSQPRKPKFEIKSAARRREERRKQGP